MKKWQIYVALYVDENPLICNEEAIGETIKALKEASLVLKVYDSLGDYLSCEIKFSKDGCSEWLGQLHLIKKLKNKIID